MVGRLESSSTRQVSALPQRLARRQLARITVRIPSGDKQWRIGHTSSSRLQYVAASTNSIPFIFTAYLAVRYLPGSN
jgi:hypothetical protein